MIASIGGDTTDASLTHSEMRYPVPSAIALLDSNGDNATDRLCFGDLGGQVWRVDLKEALNASSTGADVGLIGKLADLSIAEARRRDRWLRRRASSMQRPMWCRCLITTARISLASTMC